MTKRTEAIAQRDAARATLRRRLRVGSVVHVTQRHVSRSGMMRYLSLSIIRNGQHVDITREAADALGERIHWHGGSPVLKVGGCGMNMHFHIVYSLARSIRPNGHACTGESNGLRRCPSNDHTNDYGRLVREWREAHDDGDDSDDAHAEMRAWMDAQETHDRKRRHSDAGYSLNYRTV